MLPFIFKSKVFYVLTFEVHYKEMSPTRVGDGIGVCTLQGTIY